MKQRDVFAIVMVAIVVAIGAWLITNSLVVTEASKKAEVEIAEPYVTEFNSNAILLLTNPEALSFYKTPNLDAAGSDHTLTPGQ